MVSKKLFLMIDFHIQYKIHYTTRKNCIKFQLFSRFKVVLVHTSRFFFQFIKFQVFSSYFCLDCQISGLFQNFRFFGNLEIITNQHSLTNKTNKKTNQMIKRKMLGLFKLLILNTINLNLVLENICDCLSTVFLY